MARNKKRRNHELATRTRGAWTPWRAPKALTLAYHANDEVPLAWCGWHEVCCSYIHYLELIFIPSKSQPNERPLDDSLCPFHSTMTRLSVPLLLLCLLAGFWLSTVQGFFFTAFHVGSTARGCPTTLVAASSTSSTEPPSINGVGVNGSVKGAASTAAVSTASTASASNTNTATALEEDYYLENTRQLWKEKIQALAFRTMCGFKASRTDQQRMTYLLQQLAATNPTAEPAAAYYPTDAKDDSTNPPSNEPSLVGRWTLIYTDAPDILSLADSDTLARVQRIGQDCDGTTIANVIEWIPPVWAGALPVDKPQRVLQRVVTKALASPEAPTKVNLLLQGLEVALESPNDENKGNATTPWWPRQPFRVQGPLTAPFGSFEILYLDDELRVIRTNQGFYAVNKRNTPESEWFV